MTWAVWLQVIGWFGSALLVVSVLQTRFLRFRLVNTVASLVLAGYNWALGSWPQVAMNAVLACINVYFLIRSRQQSSATEGSATEGEGHDESS